MLTEAPLCTLLGAPPATENGAVDIALFGVPFDLGTAWRNGSRLGPSALRTASAAMRGYNHALGFSPFEKSRVADMGDVTINPFDKAQSYAAIEAVARDLIERGAAPVAVGGDHSVSLPLLRAQRPQEPLGLVTFDAHHDTRDEYFGDRFNYATPFRRAVEEGLIDPRRTAMIGIRNCIWTANDYDWALSQGIRLVRIEEIDDKGVAAVSAELRSLLGGKPFYLSFDIDGLDAVYAPGTGFPEPNGLTMREATALVRGFAGLPLVGADLCEVNPVCDVANVTALNAAHLLFEIVSLASLARTAT